MPTNAVDPASGTPGRDFLRAIGAQNNTFERLFFEWIESYNSEGDLDIFWACVQEDDSEVRLTSALNDRIEKALGAFIIKLAQDPSISLGLDVEGKVDWLTDKSQAG